MSSVEAARRELARHIGYRERGENDTPFNHEFGRLPGYPHNGYGYPWCHSFLSVCLKRAGLTPNEDFPYTAGCETGVAWFRQRGRFGPTPRVGALVYYGPGGGTHVEWVQKVTATEIVTIGGNTSGSLEGRYYNGDGVYEKHVPRNSPRIYGYGYPNYEEDDVPLTDAELKKIANAVYDRFTHTVTEDVWAAREGILEVGQRIDPRTAFRQDWAYSKDTNARVRRLEKALAAQDATIKQLAAALAARDEAIDVEALVARIRQEIAQVTVRLDVADAPAS